MTSSLRLELALKSSLFDPDRRTQRVEHRAGSEPPRYRVFVYLDGPALPWVSEVTYRLHPTFKKPEIRVQRTPANPRCKAEIWTWGTFEATALVTDKRGGSFEISAWLDWDRDLPAAGSEASAGP
jgi:hypothetical protein